jgi:hypothetical protein
MARADVPGASSQQHQTKIRQLNFGPLDEPLKHTLQNPLRCQVSKARGFKQREYRRRAHAQRIADCV